MVVLVAHDSYFNRRIIKPHYEKNMSQIQRVSFLSEGVQISALIYLPSGYEKDKAPGVVLCQGFAGIKEMLLPAYA
jgi:hypothetical protein